MTTQTTVSVDLETRQMWCGDFVSLTPKTWNQFENTGKTIHCPHGHTSAYNSRYEKLEQEIESQKRYSREIEETLRHERNSHTATKGNLTKLKNRVNAGVCPHCKRNFQNVARHMKSKHADQPDRS